MPLFIYSNISLAPCNHILIDCYILCPSRIINDKPVLPTPFICYGSNNSFVFPFTKGISLKHLYFNIGTCNGESIVFKVFILFSLDPFCSLKAQIA